MALMRVPVWARMAAGVRARLLGGLELTAGSRHPRSLLISPLQRVSSVVVEGGSGIVVAAAPSRTINGVVFGEGVGSSSSSSVLTELRRRAGELFQLGLWLIKRTFQPSLIRRKRKHGFLHRSSTKDGIAILRRRAKKGRRKLCA